MRGFTFRENPYFKRQRELLTFTRTAGTVLVCRAGVTVTYPDLISFLAPHTLAGDRDQRSLFAPEVARALESRGLLDGAEHGEGPPEARPAPVRAARIRRVVAEGGFSIEDDIKIQVYRHL